jgi:hypothetical protein
MAGILNFVGGLLIIAGLIIGFNAGNDVNRVMSIFGQDVAQTFQWRAAMVFWISGFLSGLVFLALARIIELLTDSRRS